MASFEFLAIIFTGLGLTASITYYAMVLRNANKTRQTQLFMNLYQVYMSKEFRTIYNKILLEYDWTDPQDFWNKYGSENNMESFTEQSTVIAFFEGIGHLIKRGELDLGSYYGLLGRPLMLIYEKLDVVFDWYVGKIGYHPYPYYLYLYRRTIEYKERHPDLSP